MKNVNENNWSGIESIIDIKLGLTPKVDKPTSMVKAMEETARNYGFEVTDENLNAVYFVDGITEQLRRFDLFLRSCRGLRETIEMRNSGNHNVCTVELWES